jgi:serine/threonine protein kinase
MRLFDQACELGGDERLEFLDRQCAGNNTLRRELEAMLRWDAGANGAVDDALSGAALRALAIDFASSDSPAIDQDEAGKQIGNYRLERRLGEGGMGVVYLAEQENPRRHVALKLIRRSAASPAMLRRFGFEAGLLGRLHHPGIAQVFEAGVADTRDGPQPFIAMELVNGLPLTEYAQAHALSTRQRLALMAKVADAVQHAHQRGVIHRDLKPVNILVVDHQPISESLSSSTSLEMQVGQPKILDFGVARVVDPELQITTIQTSVGQLIGTLPYMSPEQVSGDPEEIDTRSDVYALGVVLYQLLTGKLPHDLKGRSLPDAVRIIREEQHGPLSTMDRTLRGEIETIISKALEKNKERRYASALDLALDIRRYLNNEPIIARPATAIYQLRKFAQRHKALVGGAAATFIVLIAAIVMINASRIEAGRERTEAQRQTQIVQAVNNFWNMEVLAQASPSMTADRGLTMREALDAAAERIEGRFEDAAIEAAIRYAIGMTHRSLGELPQASEHLEKSLALSRNSLGFTHLQTVQAMDGLGELYVWLGRVDEAEALLTQAREIARTSFASDHAIQLEVLNDLAQLYQLQSKYKEAEDLYLREMPAHCKALGEEHVETLSANNGLAMLYDTQGRVDLAEPLYVRNLEVILRKKGKDHPDAMTASSNLGALYLQQRNLEKADELLSGVLETCRRVRGDNHPETIVGYGNLAVVRMEQNRLDEAQALLEQAVEASRRTLGEESLDTLTAKNNLGNLYQRQAKTGQAEELYKGNLDVCRRVLGESHFQTIVAAGGLAKVCVDLNRLDEAERLALGCFEWLSKNFDPQSAMTRRTIELLAQIYERKAMPEQASTWRAKLGTP